MFWHILDDARKNLLKQLSENPPVPGSYLAGGTALALQFGHRESVDFDWFSPTLFSTEIIEKKLSKIGSFLTTEAKRGTYHGIVNNIQVTWLHYPNPLVKPLIDVTDVPSLKLASPVDIGIMKIAAVSHRGARKDFIDLYMICQQGISLLSLLKLLPQKFPQANINFYHMIKSLVYFDDAEREPMPAMYSSVYWNEIIDFFLKEQKELFNNL
ncbi:nucleotidyl transferase AbiEii/AbiGii toxin family protein [Microaerobacter geothermalis]|uniref:nucleotidyl transferase AbiEii/AbiGii toxin family protein n=1 Tax=Microaerobacter geothermalis TaxID=674972 RepID=UPI001F1C04E2|nr:nucleotidyl transferase AbiEii/AbiGii toxin family protein [Microaerobacter geothermalis]MCF6094259.1 nucleotidyl transferase AbiEii/AbiGii toxin family protein [Microaerobacter geothermalis]